MTYFTIARLISAREYQVRLVLLSYQVIPGSSWYPTTYLHVVLYLYNIRNISYVISNEVFIVMNCLRLEDMDGKSPKLIM